MIGSRLFARLLISGLAIAQRIRQARGWVLLIVIVGVLAVALTGCNPTRFRTESAQVSQLVFASPSNPSTFNPPLNTSFFSTTVFGLINRGLAETNGVTGEIEPELAESWEISEDGLQIIYTLRDGLKWSDGQPLTADDVVFTFQDIYLNEAIPTSLRDILRIGATGAYPSVKKLDRRRIEFTAPAPFAPFLTYSGGIDILPKHMLEDTLRSDGSAGQLKFFSTWGIDADPREIICNGPYRIKKFVPSERLIFERNPYYWRSDAEGNPPPDIDRIILQIMTDKSQLISFRSGGLDTLEVTPEGFELLKREEARGKFTLYNGGPAFNTRFLDFNLNQARNSEGKPLVDPIKSRWFNTLAFRQAVAYAIDRERMKNTIYRGLGELQHSPINPQSPFYLSPKAGLKTYRYNPQRSKQLLKEAGFTYNSRGQLMDWDGNRVRFKLLVKSEEKSRLDAAAQIAEDLSKIGMQVDLQVLSFNTVIENLTARNWESYVGGFANRSLDPLDPHSGFNVWFSQGRLHQFNQGPRPNEDPPIQGWQVSDWEKAIDRLFTLGVKELDETKRREIYNQFQQIVQEQVPFFYLVNSLALEAARDRVQNFKFTALGGAFWNVHELEVREK